MGNRVAPELTEERRVREATAFTFGNRYNYYERIFSGAFTWRDLSKRWANMETWGILRCPGVVRDITEPHVILHAL